MKTTKQNRSPWAAALLLLPIIGIPIAGCEPEDNPSDLYPTVWIEEPTSDPAYTTSENTINIGGVVEIARDEVYVTNLRTGTQYEGITTFNSQEREFVWTVQSIALEPGDNVIQVIARYFGNDSYAYITITRTQ